MRDVVEVRKALDHGMSEQIVHALNGTENSELKDLVDEMTGIEARAVLGPWLFDAQLPTLPQRPPVA